MLLRNEYVTVNGGAGEDTTWTVSEVLKSKNAGDFIVLYLEDMGTYPYIKDVAQRERTFNLVWDAANSQVIADVTEPVQVDNVISPLDVLIVLKEQYNALSADRRDNPEEGGVLLAEINRLDAEVKATDASIGISSTGGGSYAPTKAVKNKTAKPNTDEGPE